MLVDLELCILSVKIVGERVVGRGSDLYQLCKDIDETIKGLFIGVIL